jgi:hypothetical protein
MSIKIAFPTDFTVESLNLVKQAIEDHPNEKIDFLLVHGIHATDSITDLLFFSKGKIISSLTNPVFEEVCSMMRKHFAPAVNSFRIELFMGFTQTAFTNFMISMQVNKIYLPESYNLKLKNKMSADLMPYIQRSKIKKIGVDWKVLESGFSSNSIAQLLHI